MAKAGRWCQWFLELKILERPFGPASLPWSKTPEKSQAKLSRESTAHFFQFFFFFLMWTILKVFIEFVSILLLFIFWFWLWGMWSLSSLTRDGTHTPSTGRQSLKLQGPSRDLPGSPKLSLFWWPLIHSLSSHWKSSSPLDHHPEHPESPLSPYFHFADVSLNTRWFSIKNQMRHWLGSICTHGTSDLPKNTKASYKSWIKQRF